MKTVSTRRLCASVRTGCLGLAAIIGAVTFPAAASEAIVSTNHSLDFSSGRSIAYRADAGRLDVRDDAGVVRASFFYVAYRIPTKGKPRPLTFVWNGGPGSNASTLHFFGFGPERIAAGRFIDNPDSLLATSDLVFFDPVSTGYSRAVPEDGAEAFYGTLADIDWTARFVAAWRTANKAEGQPLFLLGESFGVPRATGAAEQLAKRNVPLRGVVLISGGKIAVDRKLSPALAEALAIPNKAISAFEQGRVSGVSAKAVGREAEAWARRVYAPALERIASLTDAERDAVAEGLATRLGIAAASIDRKTLNVTSRSFLETLVPGKRLHPFDMRKEMAPDPDKPANDKLILAYLKSTLGYGTGDRYWNIEPGQPNVNASWKYTGTPADFAAAMAGGGPPESMPWLSRAIALNPHLRAFVGVGVFDSQNSCEANEALRAIMPAREAGAVSTHCYWGGHTIFKDDEARAEVSRDIARFIKTNAR